MPVGRKLGGNNHDIKWRVCRLVRICIRTACKIHRTNTAHGHCVSNKFSVTGYALGKMKKIKTFCRYLIIYFNDRFGRHIQKDYFLSFSCRQFWGSPLEYGKHKLQAYKYYL